MSSVSSVEQAYEILAREIIEFVDGRPWQEAKGIYQVLNKSTSHKWRLIHQGEECRKGKSPLLDASGALFFLRDDIQKTTGDRIWGLTFTLFPDGKFRIEYDYNKPEGYEETDETIEIDPTKDVLGGSAP